MKENSEQTSEGLNQLIEIINAKGDTGELNKIVERSNNDFVDKKGDAKS
ncbi:hypothetical protein [Metabacillus sediminilitoris]|nr:hypothetical protein [Metabacillus sediminilitoris]